MLYLDVVDLDWFFCIAHRLYKLGDVCLFSLADYAHCLVLQVLDLALEHALAGRTPHHVSKTHALNHSRDYYVGATIHVHSMHIFVIILRDPVL